MLHEDHGSRRLFLFILTQLFRNRIIFLLKVAIFFSIRYNLYIQ